MIDLKSLKQLKDLAGGVGASGQFMLLAIDDVVSEAQVRKNFTDIKELAESIKAEGLQQPINVAKRADGKYVIIQGERRWRACKQLGMTKIEAIVRPQLKENKDRSILQLIENLQRQDMDAFEIGDAFNALIENAGMTQSDLAKRIGWSVSRVSRYVAVSSIPNSIRETISKFGTQDYIALQDISKVSANGEKTQQALEQLLEAGLPLNRKNAQRVAEFVKGNVDDVIEIKAEEQQVQAPQFEDQEKDSASTKEPQLETEATQESAEVSASPVKETQEPKKSQQKMLLPDDVREVGLRGYRLKVAVQLPDEIVVGYLATNLLCRNPDKVCVIHGGKPYTFFNHQIAVLGLVAEEEYNEEA